MAVKISIGIAGATSTTFATTPIPVVELTKAPGGELLSSRSEINNLALGGRSNWGTPAKVRGAYGTKYQWSVNAVVTESEMLQLGALALWQNENPSSALRLIDEVEYLDPVDSQARPMLATLAPSWNAAYEYGYGVFSVLLLLEEGWRQRFGRYNEDLYQVQFRVEEI